MWVFQKYIFNGKFYFSVRDCCRVLRDKFTLWRVHVGYVNSEVLPEHWVGNNGKGQAKDGDGTANVGDVSQGLLVAVG